MIALASNLMWDVILGFLGFIDSIIYSLVSLFAQGFFNIADTKFSADFYSSTIGSFSSRIYIILGVFMLFKLAVSLLNCIVNPDNLTDKQNGMQKIIPRVITSLILLTFIPTLFTELSTLQNAVIPVIPKIIIGYGSGASSNTSDIGEMIAATSMKTFISPDPDSGCSAESEEALNNISSVKGTSDLITKTCPGSKTYQYKYSFLISTIIGIVLAFILISFSLDIAIRMIKMFLLQVIAPIPIISYVDPKAAKDGAFSAWTKSLVSTYIDIFIKLGIMYFVIYVISEIITKKGNILFGGSAATNSIAASYVMLFLIVGLLLFAKEAPKFLKDMLNVKPTNNSAGLAALTGAAGAVMGGGGLTGAASGALNGATAAAEANAQGKVAPGAYSTNRDRIAQLTTGNSKAKGGVIAKMDNALKNKMASNAGLSEENLKKAESNMYAEKEATDEAQYKYDQMASDYGAFNVDPEPDAFTETDPGVWTKTAPTIIMPNESSTSFANRVQQYADDKAQFDIEKENYTKHQQEYKDKKAKYDAGVIQKEMLRVKMEGAHQSLYSQQNRAAAAEENYKKGKELRGGMVQSKPKYTAKKQFNPKP